MEPWFYRKGTFRPLYGPIAGGTRSTSSSAVEQTLNIPSGAPVELPADVSPEDATVTTSSAQQGVEHVTPLTTHAEQPSQDEIQAPTQADDGPSTRVDMLAATIMGAMRPLAQRAQRVDIPVVTWLKEDIPWKPVGQFAGMVTPCSWQRCGFYPGKLLTMTGPEDIKVQRYKCTVHPPHAKTSMADTIFMQGAKDNAAKPSVMAIHLGRWFVTADFLGFLWKVYVGTTSTTPDIRRTVQLMWHATLERELLGGVRGSSLEPLLESLDEALPDQVLYNRGHLLLTKEC